MRQLSNFIALYFLIFLAACQAEDREYKHSTITELQHSFFSSLENEDWEDSFNMMSSSFRNMTTVDFYVDVFRKSNFSMLEYDIDFMNAFEGGGYFHVHLKFKANGTQRISNIVVFVSKENGEWKIDNFPFTKLGFPQFIEIPGGLKNGIYNVESS